LAFKKLWRRVSYLCLQKQLYKIAVPFLNSEEVTSGYWIQTICITFITTFLPLAYDSAIVLKCQGPGLFFIMPCIDTYRKVDLRTVSFDVPPQEVGTGLLLLFFLSLLYSTLLHLPPLRLHCVGGCWDRTQDCSDFGIGSQTL
jgi:hypothetical protein